MSIDVYPPKGLLVPGTVQVTETINMAASPSGYIMVATGDTRWDTSWRVPENFIDAPVTFRWLLHASASGGTAYLLYYTSRNRVNQAEVILHNLLNTNISPANTNAIQLPDMIIAAGNLVPGDSLKHELYRGGDNAADTSTQTLYFDGLSVTYLVTTPRVFNAQPYEEGSFTVTATGFSGTAPSGTARYVRVGKQVTLALPSLTGTSNSTTMTITGFPLALTGIGGANPVSIVDNNTNLIGLIEPPGSVIANTIRVLKDAGGTGFVASSTKGLTNCLLTYILQ